MTFINLHNHSEYCLAGDTVIFNCTFHGNREDYTRLDYCKTIKYLYDAETCAKRGHTAKKYKVKVFDGEKFSCSKIKNIVKSSPKQLYQITSESGKIIKASDFHKFLTYNGWKRLGDLKVNDLLACNGIPVYQDKEWLKKKYLDEGLNQNEIAELTNINRDVIKRWINKYSLHKTKTEWMQNHLVSDDTREKLRAIKLRKREELKNVKMSPSIGASRYRTNNGWFEKQSECERCKSQKGLLTHHRNRNPLDNNQSNLETLCKSCHEKEHSPCPWTVKYEKIVSIEKAGIEETYDLEVFHDSHNFVANGFVVHNSQLDGLGKPEQYARRAKELGQPAIAITDHGNVDGSIKWQKACKKEGVKSIIGCEMYIVPDMKIRQKEKKGHVTILVKNQEGWKTLLKMLTVANLDGFYGRPRIDYDLLYENLNEGLVVLTGCSGSFLTLPGGQDLFLDLVDLKMGNIYLEVMPHCIPGQGEINNLCLKLSQEVNVPLVATNDCHYVLPDQWKAQEVLLAIQRKAKWNDPNRWKFGFTGLHLRSEEEMMKEFEKQGVLSKRQYMLAIMNTNRIAEQCWSFQIPQKLPELPLTKYEKNSPTETAIEILDHFCRSSFFKGQEKVNWNDAYEERYQLEYEIIKKKDFARYFLIIYELVEWAKNNEIAIGPGRGSVGGSLIALLLGIIQVDPLKYGLIFERFISEDRIDLPDIDLDFDKDKADLIKKHLEEEYGEYNIAGIGTFLSMQAKAVVRDIGRVFDIPSKEVDTFAKSIKYDQKENVVEHSIETKEGKDFAERYPEQFQLACDLEGQCRGSGQHPAGLIISRQDLRETDRCNLTVREGSKVINWDMGDSEVVGLIKIDVLRLGTLTVLDEIRKMIGGNFRFEGLSFDDQNVFDFISKDSLAGIFQLTGYDCAKLCREYKIESLEDIAAIISLARPGPKGSGMTEQYIQRKKGRKWEPLHPIYEEITKETYGVMVYQEQMMRAVMDLAGFSGSDADRIRKVIGKKRDPKEFEPFRESFLRGCLERNTLTEDQANEFWQGLLGWANYGFCKAHAIEYAMIGYWTAWAKCCCFDEFLCASLTYGDDGDKEHLIEEAQGKGIQVVTSKVNFSDIRKWVIKDQRLYMPFTEIKGIGEKEAEKCLNIKPARQGFFTLGKTLGSESNNATQKLLTEIKAFDPDPEARPDDCSSYFQFNIGKNHKLLSPIIITKKRSIIDRNALECHACGLRQQARQVVLSSSGIYNAAIIAEAPGKRENAKGIGLIGDSGDLLWPELERHGITRRMVHVENACKCFPSKTRTPSYQEADTCFNKWLVPEIQSMDCKLVLGLGGIVYYALTGKTSGITKASGKMEWIEKIQSWVVWCVHPSFVLRKRSPENVQLFEAGVKAFAEQFEGRKR